jgi:hypothetical protein
MGERSDLPRLIVTVDPKLLKQCKWCGGAVGTGGMRVTSHFLIWTRSRTFCSKTCLTANKSLSPFGPCFFIITLLCTVLLIINGYLIEAVSFIVIFNLLGICYLREFFKGRDAASQIPRNSRRNETLDDTAMLYATTTDVFCPNCNCNIDLDEVGADLVYRCEYCGVTGFIELVYLNDK